MEVDSKNIPYRFPKRGSKYSTTFAWHEMSQETHRLKFDIIKPYLGYESVGAELGVFNGGFAEYLRTRCKKLYLVDWMKHKKYDCDKWKNIIERIYDPEIQLGTIETHWVNIKDFLHNKPDNYFDFLYLDADHSYHGTQLLAHLSYKKLKPGGYLILDDYDIINWPTVVDAINDMVKYLPVSVVELEYGQAVMQKPSRLKSISIKFHHVINIICDKLFKLIY